MMNVLCLFIGFFPSETKFYIKQLCSYSDSFLDVYIHMCVYEGGKRKTERWSKRVGVRRKNLVI